MIAGLAHNQTVSWKELVSVCCRFFFLSNDELLEILAEAKEPRNMQSFVKKCFEAVKEFIFADDGKITGMVSVEGQHLSMLFMAHPVQQCMPVNALQGSC